MDAKLTPAQAAALERFQTGEGLVGGKLHAYNGVSAATIGALEAKGLVTVEWSCHTYTNRRSGRFHAVRDWSASLKEGM